MKLKKNKIEKNKRKNVTELTISSSEDNNHENEKKNDDKITVNKADIKIKKYLKTTKAKTKIDEK